MPFLHGWKILLAKQTVPVSCKDGAGMIAEF